MLVLVGRSCVGKDTIQKILCDEYGMDRVITYTTRPPREGEVDGVDYHFMSDEQFKFCLYYCFAKDIAFAEYTEYHVASGETWYYGSKVCDYFDSDNKVIILNPEGLKCVRDNNFPVFAIEITAPDKAIMDRQMIRGDDLTEATRRFNADLLDFADISKYTDTCVINWGDTGPERCAKNIYNLYQHWLSKQKDKNSK